MAEMMERTITTIVGAGPVGLAFALMRAQTGEAIALVDKVAEQLSDNDARSLALSYGSLQTLNLLGLDVQKMAHAPIEHIHISEQNAWGHTQLHSAECDLPLLGAVVRYGDLVAQLNRLIEQHDNIQLIRPASIQRLSESEHSVRLNLSGESQRELDTELLVHAEGGLFDVNEVAQKDYQQSAFICNVTFKKAQFAWAWERFTKEGPIALLPASHDGCTFNLVWCMDRERAQAVEQCSDAEFLVQLNEVIGHLTGQIIAVAPRTIFPLGLKRAAALHSKRRVCIGNAAQTLHPVAGQGFNLGLRDAVILNQSLQAQPSIAQAISAFAHHRGLDRNVTTWMTDVLAGGFFNDFGVNHVRNLGFGLINAIPPLKQRIAQQFMFGVR